MLFSVAFNPVQKVLDRDRSRAALRRRELDELKVAVGLRRATVLPAVEKRQHLRTRARRLVRLDDAVGRRDHLGQRRHLLLDKVCVSRAAYLA